VLALQSLPANLRALHPWAAGKSLRLGYHACTV